MFHSLGQYEKAVEFHTKDFNMSRELGNRTGEGRSYCNLGCAFSRLGQYDKAVKFHTKDLNMSHELGDRSGETRAKCNLEIARKREFQQGVVNGSAQPSE